jgi:hypothetical protein
MRGRPRPVPLFDDPGEEDELFPSPGELLNENPSPMKRGAKVKEGDVVPEDMGESMGIRLGRCDLVIG